jgi:hypothetical protein
VDAFNGIHDGLMSLVYELIFAVAHVLSRSRLGKVFGIPVAALAAYLAAKYEGSRPWTALSVLCWSVVSFVILGALSLLLALPIAAAKVLLAP